MQETTGSVSHQEECFGHPGLVLFEQPNGAVSGVVMREMKCFTHVDFADGYPEPLDAERGVEILRRMAPGDPYSTWQKESNIDAASLADAIASTPESSVGHKDVFVYRGNEWLWGIWKNPARSKCRADTFPAGVELTSVADLHGTRVSREKRAKRPGLESLRANQVLVGSYPVLEAATALVAKFRPEASEQSDPEAHPAVRHLCEWWNRQAPDGSREAGVVRLYVWNENAGIFNPCDPEEPPAPADQIATQPSYALFEHPGKPTVVACFYRGRSFNKDMGDDSTMTFAADGSNAYWIGREIVGVDEAQYSVVGLQNLAKSLSRA